MTEEAWDKFEVTSDELNKIGEAFKSEDFRKLFIDYCTEISNPDNRKIYETELKELEAERGIDIKFINPEAGFVIKTIADGKQKIFINVAKSSEVNAPTSERGQNEKTGEFGLNWSIPYIQSKPKQDFDNSKNVCPVYDVIFHPDALHLAKKDTAFKKLVIDTACQAVKITNKLELDLINLKFPKIGYKGASRPMVIRKKIGASKVDEQNDPIKNIYPPVVVSSPEQHKHNNSINEQLNETLSKYTTPKYDIVHRRDIEMSELTNELDAKLNITVPKELVVKINLPLLRTSKDLSLDVNVKSINLKSESPAKYKLDLTLPFEVDKLNGKAQFDSDKRILQITLPVVRRKKIGIADFHREDSGVESDHHSPKEDNSSSDDVFEDAIDVSPKRIFKRNDVMQQKSPSKSKDEAKVAYNLPQFTFNRFENAIAFTLNVKNIQNDSISISSDNSNAIVKFSTIGNGFVPINYSFYFDVSPNNLKSIPTTDIWDNNMIIQVNLESSENFHSYRVGIDSLDCKEYICSPSHEPIEKLPEDNRKTEINENISVEMSLEMNEFQISIKNKNFQPKEEISNEANNNKSKNIKSKKPKKKNRSYSESYCEELIAAQEEIKSSINNPIVLASSVKSRTMSESSNDEQFVLKSILKRHSSYDRQFSECSTDDCINVGSVDLGIGSFTSIPEENDRELSESVRKTVRFDKQLCRKFLFRLNSTIVGQRKPKENKRKRKRKKGNGERRYSESEASDYENHPQKSISFDSIENNKENKTNGATTTTTKQNSNEKCYQKNNNLMFDLEM